MDYVKYESAVKHANSNCIVYEYPTLNPELSIAVAEISHRYPDQGFASNHDCSEMGYVVKGSGKLFTESTKVALSVGDIVHIPSGEKFYWEGNITVVFTATPAWSFDQHKKHLPALKS